MAGGGLEHAGIVGWRVADIDLPTRPVGIRRMLQASSDWRHQRRTSSAHRARSLLAVPLVLALSACAGGKETSVSDVKIRVAAQLEESGLDRKAAEYFAGEIVDEVGADKVRDVDFSAKEPDAAAAEDIAAAAAKAISVCDLGGGSSKG